MYHYCSLDTVFVVNEIYFIVLFVENQKKKITDWNILAKAKMSKMCFTKTYTRLWKMKLVFQRQQASLGHMYLPLQRHDLHLWCLHKDIKDAKDKLDIFLMMAQIYDIDEDDNVNRRNAEDQEMFRKPLYKYASPLCADVCFEGKWWLILC